MSKKTILLILDGFGLSDNINNNAIAISKTPTLNYFFERYPWSRLETSGLSVGLPKDQMGNSEVGHLNIGAGRVVYQDLTHINKSIEDKSFFKNSVLLSTMKLIKKNNNSLHIMGLLSDGGVHSHISHLYALLDLASRYKLERVYIHAFMDGRDTSPHSGKLFLYELEKNTKERNCGKIASIIGRYYAMDRDNRWDRIELTYKTLTNSSEYDFDDCYSCINYFYDRGITDEFINPSIIIKEARIKKNDSIIFFNFRPDRAREITKVFCDENFDNFDRKYLKTKFICFTDYDISIKNKLVVYHKQNLNNTLGEYISKIKLKQLRLAETEKYAHVTFFFDGGKEKIFENEDRILIPSPKVATYDLKPEMSVYLITQKFIEQVLNFDVSIVNFANCDMVGHTGNMTATVKAVEAVDDCLGKIYNFVKLNNLNLIICADHGNAEQMLDFSTKEIFTSHTKNPVPFIFINTKIKKSHKIKDGSLCDISPTILDLIDISKPIEMTGKSLI
ncbi:MAG: 2,3-bisphosphoglycerate-independent phosphoglycerate mutase [Clostridiales bacterium]|jgi:2,3-bisphosphoglycerate-independent phosphoglycerate mutase|nr:2,3-bisphosphoglycerate-independent phosphoglycerate mutase [Clostridiales bacterium]